jgi:hypothetical protein
MNYQRRITNPETLEPGMVIRMVTRDRLETEYVAPFSDCIVLEVRIGALEVDLKRPYAYVSSPAKEERFTATFSKLKQQGWVQVFDSHGKPCQY